MHLKQRTLGKGCGEAAPFGVCHCIGSPNQFDVRKKTSESEHRGSEMSKEEKEGTSFTKTLRQLVTILLCASLI